MLLHLRNWHDASEALLRRPVQLSGQRILKGNDRKDGWPHLTSPGSFFDRNAARIPGHVPKHPEVDVRQLASGAEPRELFC